jgi:hypothetical protein
VDYLWTTPLPEWLVSNLASDDLLETNHLANHSTLPLPYLQAGFFFFLQLTSRVAVEIALDSFILAVHVHIDLVSNLSKHQFCLKKPRTRAIINSEAN